MRNISFGTLISGAALVLTALALCGNADAADYTIVHNFTGTPDGDAPFDGLVFDGAKNGYGTTDGGGAFGYGAIFELSPNGNVTVLHSFDGNTEGGYPRNGVILDNSTGDL